MSTVKIYLYVLTVRYIKREGWSIYNILYSITFSLERALTPQSWPTDPVCFEIYRRVRIWVRVGCSAPAPSGPETVVLSDLSEQLRRSWPERQIAEHSRATRLLAYTYYICMEISTSPPSPPMPKSLVDDRKRKLVRRTYLYAYIL